MPDTALLIIDVQVGFFENEPPVYQGDAMLARIQDLIERARAAGVPVVFVQHDEAPEIDGPIHPAIAPLAGDPVVHKMTPDSFYQTDLQEILAGLGTKKLILAGFQTEYCIDTTCRRAFSMGYEVTLVQDAHSTITFPDAPLDAPAIIAHHNHVLRAFASVIPAGALAL
ncbi:MAG: cysteine hydrolase [Anaerolineae bacterium]|nr:cysteine hydrolase [Anaerolineae bacterium]